MSNDMTIYMTMYEYYKFMIVQYVIKYQICYI